MGRESAYPAGEADFHVVIDMETALHAGPLSEEFPHETYCVRREDATLYVSMTTKLTTCVCH